MIAETLRSMFTGSHLQRVSAYSALLADRLGMDADLLRVASRLHDVGMASVPEAIQLKPGPLTDAERRAMREHAEVGFALLAGSGAEPLDTAADIALAHHERWDGGGYPHGLGGEDIPRPARIVAVADTFDALTTDRVYRPAGTIDAAEHVLRAERGRQLDPAVVDAFLASLDAAVEILERFAERAGAAPAEPGQLAAGVAQPERDGAQMTLQAAAAALSVSPSRLRRWADEGRIPAIRTVGGHRRFPLEAVRRLAVERGVRPNVRAVEPPSEALPELSRHIRAHGRQMAAAAAAAVYRDGPPGWFASEAATDDLREWLEALERAGAQGAYAGVLQSSETLMRRAQLHAASLLERHAFLERFGQVAVRVLARAGADRTEIAGTRRLFTSLQQALLESRD